MLLLIAITVSLGVVTYIWMTGLVAAVKAGVGEPTIYKLVPISYDFTAVGSPGAVSITVRNIGHTNVTIARVHFAGLPVSTTPSLPQNIAPFTDKLFTFNTPAGVSPIKGATYVITLITSDAAKFNFPVVAGRRG